MKPVPLPEWDRSLNHVVDDMRGRPLNVHSLMANHPDLLNAWWDFRNYVVRGGTLKQRDCELVILRVAVHMQSWYEWASHVDRGLAAGLSIEEIEQVRQGPDSPVWNDSDTALLQAVDELFNARRISPITKDRLCEHFNAQQILDVIAIHGMYVTLGGIINTWGLELDESVSDRLPAELARDGFEQGVNKDA